MTVLATAQIEADAADAYVFGSGDVTAYWYRPRFGRHSGKGKLVGTSAFGSLACSLQHNLLERAFQDLHYFLHGASFECVCGEADPCLRILLRVLRICRRSLLRPGQVHCRPTLLCLLNWLPQVLAAVRLMLSMLLISHNLSYMSSPSPWSLPLKHRTSLCDKEDLSFKA